MAARAVNSGHAAWLTGRLLLGTGCQWRDIPKDLPPRSTIHDYLDRWSYDGTLQRIHHALYTQCRELAGRRSQSDGCGD